MDKTWNNKAWFMVLPVLLLVAFSAVIPLMTVVNYSVQDTFGNNVFFWAGTNWFQEVLQSRPLLRDAAGPQPHLLRPSSWLIEIPLGIFDRARPCRAPGWGVPVCLVLMALPLLIPWNVVGTIWQIFGRVDIGLLGYTLNALGIDYNFTSATRSTPGSPSSSWTSGTGRRLVVLLCYAGLRLDPRRLLPGGQDRRRLALGGVPLHPAAEDEPRAD